MRVIDILVCPECRQRLDATQEGPIVCTNCGPAGKRTKRQIRLVEFEPETSSDSLLALKERVKKRFPGLYPRLIELFSPIYSPRLLDDFLARIPPDSNLVLDLGSGASRQHAAMINIDFVAYDEVDIVGRIERLPFPDSSVDAVVSLAVMEHVTNPDAVVAEMARVLKPGGRVYCYVPFMVGIHAAPDDYHRYTPHGLEVLFNAFDERKVKVAAGPTSGLAWMLQEWVAMALSFGSRRLFWLVYALMTAVVAPLKFADAVLMRHPFAANISSAFAIEARKPLSA